MPQRREQHLALKRFALIVLGVIVGLLACRFAAAQSSEYVTMSGAECAYRTGHNGTLIFPERFRETIQPGDVVTAESVDGSACFGAHEVQADSGGIALAVWEQTDYSAGLGVQAGEPVTSVRYRPGIPPRSFDSETVYERDFIVLYEAVDDSLELILQQIQGVADTLAMAVDYYQGENDSLRAVIAGLEADNAALADANAALGSANAALEAENANLQTMYAEALAMLEPLQEENAQLLAANNLLSAENAELQDLNAALHARAASLQARINTATSLALATYNHLRGKVVALPF